jgi:5'-3' exonuclease
MSLFESQKTYKLIDLSAVIHSVAHGLFNKTDWIKLENGKYSIPKEVFRGGLIGSLLYYSNLNGKPDKTVICMDSSPYWRNEYIDYKISRKISHSENEFDMGYIFRYIRELTAEIQEHLPWIVVEVKSLEADDVIAILAKDLHKDNIIKIISADSDLAQLQKYNNVSQWSPITKKFVTPKESPELDLLDKIIRGDAKDSIPNIYTDSKFYTRKYESYKEGVEFKERQKPVNKVLINEAVKANFNPEVFCDTADMVANFERNKLLLDFDYIPNELVNECINKFDKDKKSNKFKLIDYLSKNNLNLLTEKLSEF